MNQIRYAIRPASGASPSALPPARMGLGDMMEKAFKPVAKWLKMPCLDEEEKLKPESPCAKRRDRANALGKKIGIG